ncbi:hypothetical protein, partial [Lacticaseibacillus paracasei]|uniref:hypothetical protein n=1 Tax=Lacticaseibacillus paracasei TaxID=1597 RepID=UPI00280AF15B
HYSIQTSRMPLKVLSMLKECKHNLVRLCFFCYNENTNRERPHKSAPLAEPFKTAATSWLNNRQPTKAETVIFFADF